jgi:hypothetical protein
MGAPDIMLQLPPVLPLGWTRLAPWPDSKQLAELDHYAVWYENKRALWVNTNPKPSARRDQLLAIRNATPADYLPFDQRSDLAPEEYCYLQLPVVARKLTVAKPRPLRSI